MSVRTALRDRVNAGLARLGYGLHRVDLSPEALRAKLIEHEGIDLVLDVGANAGQHALGLREAGYRGRIVSFEPLAQAFAELERLAAGDPGWDVRRLALGDVDGTLPLNVSSNSWSSSLLPIGERHMRSAPESAYVDTEEVRVARLDSVWAEIAGEAANPWLKLDVQGYELHVLRGAEQCISSVRGVQAELQLESLYEGDVDWRVIVDWLADRGFVVAGVEPGFADRATGRMLQFDGVFTRAEPPAPG